jgi:[acyl-carrier-protein] S-malonyltransferase
MGKELLDFSPAARSVFEEADAALEERISRLCFEGPDEALTDTANAQPAILSTTAAYLAAAIEAGTLRERPAYVAGHSLGQYSALLAAGSLSLTDALTLVRARGRIMARESEINRGTMAAILGMDESAVQQICRESGAEPANYNGPTQIVVGGDIDAVERATNLAKERGGKVLPVKVAGAFHTSLMRGASTAFAQMVSAVPLRDAAIPVVSNVTALPLTDAAAIRTDLIEQVAQPVLWAQSIVWMLEHGVRTFVEIGPGRTLSGMLKRIAPDAEAMNIDSVDALSGVLHV